METVNISRESVVSLFNTKKGARIYDAARRTLETDIGTDMLYPGVVVGFSGGADSLMLLLFLVEYKRRTGRDFNLLSCHINHGIRGDEALRDRDFSEAVANSLGVEHINADFDIPRISKEQHLGTEESARNCRYSFFADLIQSREDVSTVAVAHNLGDNAETVIFNMSRGSGLSGVRGILPKRGNIIRPLISVDGGDIRAVLRECGIFYVVDSTNLSLDYSRNYIRNEIIPRLEALSPHVSSAIGRMTEALRADADFIDGAAKDAYESVKSSELSRKAFLALHPAIFSRVVNILFAEYSELGLEFCHILDVKRAIEADNSSVSLPDGIEFICQRGYCRFMKKNESFGNTISRVDISDGINPIPDSNGIIVLGEQVKNISSNIYKFSIQADLSSVIIEGGLYLRAKEDGDSYRYGGMTHKLKKVFNDRNIPPLERGRIPVLCDLRGIVWVPGLGVRDDGVRGESLPVCFCTREASPGELSLVSAIKWHK